MANTLEVNISLNQLEQLHCLSNQVVNLCLKYRLTTLDKILAYYDKYRKFSDLKGFGAKAERELIKVCERYSSKTQTYIVFENDIGLDILAKIEDLSVRSYNVCRNNELDSLNKIILTFQKKKTFLHLRNCGLKTEVELSKLSQKYLSLYDELGGKLILIEENKKENDLIPLIDFSNIVKSFSPFKLSILQKHYAYLFSGLSARPKNVLLAIDEKNGSKLETILYICNDKIDFSSLRNIGVTAVKELDSLRLEMREFISKLISFEDISLQKEYAQLIINATFSASLDKLKTTIEEVFANNKLNIFKLFGILLKTKMIVDGKLLELFEYRFARNSLPSLPFLELAAKFNLSAERIRQLFIRLDKEVTDKLEFLSNFKPLDIYTYELKDTNSVNIISNELVSKINEREEVAFNLTFCKLVFKRIFNKSHHILNSSVKDKNKKTFQLNNYYLIENSLYKTFNFNQLILDVSEKLDEDIVEDYTLYLDGYLLQFANYNNVCEEIKNICEHILHYEFGIISDYNGFITFKRNKKKLSWEYIYEVLDDRGYMMKVEEIVDALKQRFPEEQFDERFVRGNIGRKKREFIYINRSSTWGLRKWESEKQNLKGGTIKMLVEEFLESQNEPKHLYEIYKYVSQYRNTSYNSVGRNIFISKKTFAWFKGSFIGLKRKDYSNVNTNYKRIIGFALSESYFRRFKGWTKDEIVKYYVRKFNCLEIQIRSIIEIKVTENLLSFDKNDVLL